MFFCKHKRVRCVHGDEINQTIRVFTFKRPVIARVVCLDCNKYLYKRELPEMCYYTKKEHWAWKNGDPL